MTTTTSDEDDDVDVSLTETFLEKTRRLVTVEPAAFLYEMGFMFLFLTNEQFVYAKMLEITTADNANMTSLNETVAMVTDCGLVEAESMVESQANAGAANFLTVYAIIFEVPGVLLAFLWGSYTDHVGRKRALIVTILGSAVRVITNFLVASFSLNINFLYFGCLIDGLSGGPAVFLGAVFAYIADVTNNDNRSQRTVVVQSMTVFGLAFSQALVGYLIKYLGFVLTYGITACVIAANLLYVTLWLRESVTDIQPCSFIRFEHITKTLMLFFRDNGTNRLWKLQVGFGILFLHNFVEIGSFPMLILFILSSPLCFSATLLGGYLSLCNILNGLGTIGALYIFYSSLGDYTLLVAANNAALVAHAWLAMPFLTDALVFLTPVLNFMANAITPLTRSLLSKTTEPSEQGTLSAGLVVCVQVSGLLGTAVFGPIYANTAEYYKGAFWIVASVILVLPIILSVYLTRRGNRQDICVEPNEETKLAETS